MNTEYDDEVGLVALRLRTRAGLRVVAEVDD